MTIRKVMDGEAERARLRAEGAGNCQICGTFFVPSAEKPWTQSGCCSKACFAKVAARDGLSSTVGGLAPETTKAARTVPVICRCGNQFRAPAIFIGALRACPKCGEKIMVTE